MRYQNSPPFKHDAPTITGILMVNLGTPDSPQIADVRRYLREFLSDPRLIELPRYLWWLILHGIILPLRPRRSAQAYSRIWNTEGSPLLIISKQQASAIQESLKTHGFIVPVMLAMRYGSPSIAAGLTTLQIIGARRILVLPLYPQYSATTTGSVFDAVTAELRKWRVVPELRFIHQYYDLPAYITALAHTINKYWAIHGQPDKLLFSFHGIPEAYSQAGDPYYQHCQITAQLVAQNLGLTIVQWQVAFQSRVGPKAWLKPYTDKILQEWGQSGINKVHVICPGFAADCLETLDEIALENREHFITAGGKEYGYIPALNTDSQHIDAIVNLIKQHIN